MLILFDFKNDLSYSYSVWDSAKRATITLSKSMVGPQVGPRSICFGESNIQWTTAFSSPDLTTFRI